MDQVSFRLKRVLRVSMTEAASGISGPDAGAPARLTPGRVLRWVAYRLHRPVLRALLPHLPLHSRRSAHLGVHAAAGACGPRRRIRMARSRPHLAEPRDPGDRRRGIRGATVRIGAWTGARSTQPPMPSRRAGRRAAAARSRCRPRRTSSSGTGPLSSGSRSSCRWPPTWISCWASSGLWTYLNIVEWAPGVYGAEAAARHHFGKSADEPPPRRRQPNSLPRCPTPSSAMPPPWPARICAGEEA